MEKQKLKVGCILPEAFKESSGLDINTINEMLSDLCSEYRKRKGADNFPEIEFITSNVKLHSFENITEDNIAKAYNEIINEDIIAFSIFGDDPNNHIKNCILNRKIDIINCPHLLFLYGGEIGQELRNCFFKCFFSLSQISNLWNTIFGFQEFSINDQQLFKKSNDGKRRSKVLILLEDDISYNKSECEFIKKALNGRVESREIVYKSGNIQEAVTDINQYDAIFLLGIGDAAHYKALKSLSDLKFNNYVFSSTTASYVLAAADSIGQEEFPFKDKGVYFINLSGHKNARQKSEKYELSSEKTLTNIGINIFLEFVFKIWDENHNASTKDFIHELTKQYNSVNYIFNKGFGNISYKNGEMSVPLSLYKLGKKSEDDQLVADYRTENLDTLELVSFLKKASKKAYSFKSNNLLNYDILKEILRLCDGSFIASKISSCENSFKVCFVNDNIFNMEDQSFLPFSNIAKKCFDFVRETEDTIGEPIEINLFANDYTLNDSKRLYIFENNEWKEPFAISQYRQNENYSINICDNVSSDCSAQHGVSSDDLNSLKNFLTSYTTSNNVPFFVYLFLTMPDGTKEDDFGYTYLLTKKHISLLDLRVLADVVDMAFIPFRRFKLRAANTKSAIGSIMSRNGSHNIGSHVLAALSHNVGTMPDDRMLYQYIQLRMDYIANVTTDAPSWSQPTMFLGEMMRTFLSQHHLLNHIAESEGLSAWEFQNKNFDNKSFQSQERKLKFHIRKIIQGSTNPEYIEILKYDNPDQEIDFSNDVALAIPGGAAGQHAFFTIIENIIRNSAKHDWSNPPKTTKHLKKVGPVEGVSETTGSESLVRKEIPHGNLEIYIDFEDKAEEGNVDFTIWTNMSDVLASVDDGDLNSQEALHNKLKDKLKLAFIDESGTLRRENWGLAEMRISAGFLQGRSISEIGGLMVPDKPIIEPVPQLDKIQAEREEAYDVNHLGYRFSVPKPKTLLVLVDDITEDKEKLNAINIVFSEWEKQADKFKKYGIYAKKYSDVKSKEKLGYEFVVMDDLREENKEWFLPFRVITINPTELEGAKELVPSLSEWKELEGEKKLVSSLVYVLKEVEGKKELVPLESCQELLNHLLTYQNKDGIDKELLDEEILNKIFACWCKYIKKRHMNNENDPVNLVLTVKENNSNAAGQGLISKRDVVKFVFEEAFNSIARSFIDLNKYENLSRENKKPGESKETICMICGRAVCNCLEEKKETFEALQTLIKPNSKKTTNFDTIHENSYDTLSIRILLNWYEYLGKKDSVLDYLKKRNGELSSANITELNQIKAEIERIEALPEKERDTRALIKLTQKMDSLENANDSETAQHYFGTFINYLVKACEQMETILSKYAENIVSLPKGFGKAADLKDSYFCEKWDDANLYFWKGPRKVGATRDEFFDEELILFDACEKFLKDEKINIKDNASIEFARHSDPNTEPSSENRKYLEPLSGSQSYLTVLERVNFNSKQIITKLVETAFLRILVIDERVAKFLREHKNEVAKTFDCMHIYVADDKKVDDELSLFQEPSKNKNIIDKLESICWDKPVLNYNKNRLLLPLSSYNIWKGRKAVDGDNGPDHEQRMINIIQKFECDQGKKLFDILIVHQGIIDKWFPGTSNDSKKVDKLLSFLKLIFPYVVITTGRGTPANIPESARMLPFSTIETTLFRKYPEKLTLIDAIMNLLPKGVRSNDQ